MTNDLCRAEFDRIWLMVTEHFKNNPYMRNEELKELCFTFWEKGWNAKPPTEQSDEFDYRRVKEWAISKPRKSANTSFTASTNRNVAYLIEDLELPHDAPTEHNPADNSQNVEYSE